MDLTFSPQETAFRDEIRAWIDANPPSAEPADGGQPMIEDSDFRRKLADMQIKVDTLNATELKVFAGRATGFTPQAAVWELVASGTQPIFHGFTLLHQQRAAGPQSARVRNGNRQRRWTRPSHRSQQDRHVQPKAPAKNVGSVWRHVVSPTVQTRL